MKKILIILIFCLSFIRMMAQSYEQQYIQEEQARITEANNIETEIKTFISQKINTYDFTDVINSVNNVKDEYGNSLSGESYQTLLMDAKKQKLRSLFLHQNPEKLKYFYADPLKQQCVNGGFEDNGGSTAGYSFGYFNYYNGWVSYGNFPFQAAPPITLPHPYAGLVNSGFDPNLPFISRVHTGNYAIQLNQSQLDVYTRSVTSLRRTFVVNQDFISFSYALFFQNPSDGGHQNDTKYPYYQVRLLSNTSNSPVLYQRNVNTSSSGFSYNAPKNLLYTGWQCEKINTSAFMGQTVTLEINISNCGNSGHIGYGYFDDFCGTNSNCALPPIIPGITLNPINSGCPMFPLPVSGNITLPTNALLTNVTIQVLNTSSNIVSSQVITSAVGGFFTTNLLSNNFYPNGYNSNTDFNIRAILNYTINGISQPPIVINNTNPPGPDVSFKNCTTPCFQDITITQPTTFSQNLQAAGTITSSSVIYPGLNVNYRAGYQIILKADPSGSGGFYASAYRSGNFHAYLARCEGSDYNIQQNSSKQMNTILENPIEDSNIKIYPNPASGYFKISTGTEKLISWEMYDISGNIVSKGNTADANVQHLLTGNYILKINVQNRQVTKKVILK